MFKLRTMAASVMAMVQAAAMASSATFQGTYTAPVGTVARPRSPGHGTSMATQKRAAVKASNRARHKARC